ncbi:hypothetical protein McanCB49686_008108, partial [Microsporum canis]
HGFRSNQITNEDNGLFEHSLDLGLPSSSSSALITTISDKRRIEIGAQILSLLDNLSFYGDVLERRFTLFEGWLFGPQITRETLQRLKFSYNDAIRGSRPDNTHAHLLEWSKTIFRNTATPIKTYPEMEFPEYVSIIAPRWETIGLIFALLGTATYHIQLDDTVLQDDESLEKRKQDLRATAVAVSDMCLQFCNTVAAISDPLCWATMQHTSFMVEMHGSTDHRTWQRLGDVTTLVFALGLHRRELDEQAPFFLTEIRKRAMIAAYSMDKMLATFLKRPPRICRQYCHFHTPLHIHWQDLLGDASIRDAAIKRLDTNGWDSRGDLESAKPRVSMLVSIIREMILEISFSHEVDNLEYKVEEIRHESNQMRLSLPPFLQWSPANKNPLATSLHLEFLYQNFLLYQTLTKRTGSISNSLTDTAHQILTLVLDTVSKQTQTGTVNHFTIYDVSGSHKN